MIDEKKLINYIKRVINPYGRPFEGTVFEFGCKVMEYIENMENVPDINVGNEWIPVSERLPEEDKKAEYYDSVIVTLDNGRVAEGCYRNMDREWWVDAPDGEHFSEDMTGHVLAWQPLPEPYKGE